MIEPQVQPIPPKPAAKSPILWSFHGKEGTKEDLAKIIAESPAPDYAKVYLLAVLDRTEGRAFRLTSIGASDHPGELTEHTRLAKIF